MTKVFVYEYFINKVYLVPALCLTVLDAGNTKMTQSQDSSSKRQTHHKLCLREGNSD